MKYFIVILTYKAELSEIDKHRDAHLEFLKTQYDKGHFLMSGPQIPRTGGVIIARYSSRDELDKTLCQDPFALNQLAHYDVQEFNPTMWADSIHLLPKE